MSFSCDFTMLHLLNMSCLPIWAKIMFYFDCRITIWFVFDFFSKLKFFFNLFRIHLIAWQLLRLICQIDFFTLFFNLFLINACIYKNVIFMCWSCFKRLTRLIFEFVEYIDVLSMKETLFLLKTTLKDEKLKMKEDKLKNKELKTKNNNAERRERREWMDKVICCWNK